MSLESIFTHSWYKVGGWTNLFRPLQPLIRNAVQKKRRHFLTHPDSAYKAPVPVVVVGNITVGGTGKSPMVAALCALLKEHGYRPGIVSRGHGASILVPTHVYPDSSPREVGDEPVMLARLTACPMVVFKKRDEAVKQLLATSDVNIVISDDGMQHYRLNRDVEIAMLDAKRGVGNGHLLPVGPLREPVERLETVDFVVSIGQCRTAALDALPLPIVLAPLHSSSLISLDGHRQLDFDTAFASDVAWHVMAGIGHPERFLNTLIALGLKTQQTSKRWFIDHHAYIASDIPAEGAVIMTEKDAVKCQALGLTNPNVWYLPVFLALPDSFKQAFIKKLTLINMDHSHE
ncbi:tetraacyldisaccharide 4'-kinase [Marinomonas sp. IMCC 4694]|uniref:tetraacyldisaccharide 4'-kinase n=1 Tax=Marinomonas sp. IMCC 4694 TaxID=2605432 RepID=UPI0011E6A81C|nr:tetraacyldisaccharide 4'-kinase [Marinomonas sp. IMCC 4694]TYL47764.1 tetraacyldisaccharide 4'-kinase [Marinomonas sp. IMCC 4694]